MKVLALFGRSREFQDKLEHSRDRLYRVAYAWCHNPAVADDLVQETLSKALRKSSQLRDLELLHSWLFSILANCWRDHFRQYKEMENVDEVAESHFASDVTPEDECAQAEAVMRIRTAVASLPLGQRQVLTLVDLEEFSYVEVAGILNVPIGTVMSRLSRARRTLKEKFIGLGDDRPRQVSTVTRLK